MTTHRCPDTLDHLLTMTAAGLVDALHSLPGFPADFRAVVIIETAAPGRDLADGSPAIVAGGASHGYPDPADLVAALTAAARQIADGNGLRSDWLN